MIDSLIKQILKSKLKSLPEEAQDKIIGAIEKNPDLFNQMAKKAREKIQNGISEQDAVMAVFLENQSKLKDILDK